MGYSDQSLSRSRIKGNYYLDLITLTYGILTPCSSWDHRVKVGSSIFSKDQMSQKLNDLSSKTKRAYTMEVINPEDFTKTKFDGLAIIGRIIDGEKITTDNDSHKLVTQEKLVSLLNESEQIIKDLKRIGFRRIKARDLYLHSGYCRA
ncbi:hypothetical protein HYW75_05690 [Candidatus Pacearchaeota archaeon]|nr:hypothetical protein [Candidatus Pacearchaeota archaeon]